MKFYYNAVVNVGVYAFYRSWCATVVTISMELLHIGFAGFWLFSFDFCCDIFKNILMRSNFDKEKIYSSLQVTLLSLKEVRAVTQGT